jgi:hypothetical protein
MADTTYFEVRCERCRTSFAPGTKSCIHCGGPLGRRFFGGDPTRRAMEEMIAGPEPVGEAPGAASRLGTILRVAMIGLVLLSAVGRACMQ